MVFRCELRATLRFLRIRKDGRLAVAMSVPGSNVVRLINLPIPKEPLLIS